MNQKLFRKKSLERIKSPENITGYIKVLNPRVWAIVICLLIFLAGVCVWGIFGVAESTVPLSVTVADGEAIAFVNDERVTSVTEGMVVKYAGVETVVIQAVPDLKNGFVCGLEPVKDLGNGVYEGVLVTKSTRPILLLFD